MGRVNPLDIEYEIKLKTSHTTDLEAVVQQVLEVLSANNKVEIGDRVKSVSKDRYWVVKDPKTSLRIRYFNDIKVCTSRVQLDGNRYRIERDCAMPLETEIEDIFNTLYDDTFIIEKPYICLDLTLDGIYVNFGVYKLPQIAPDTCYVELETKSIESLDNVRLRFKRAFEQLNIPMEEELQSVYEMGKEKLL